LNAYVCDALAATGSEPALAMTLRHRGADLPLDRRAGVPGVLAASRAPPRWQPFGLVWGCPDPAARAGPRSLSPSEGGRLEHTDKAAALSVSRPKEPQWPSPLTTTSGSRASTWTKPSGCAARSPSRGAAWVTPSSRTPAPLHGRRCSDARDIDLDGHEAYWWLCNPGGS
jgi:hypothetical protein